MNPKFFLLFGAALLGALPVAAAESIFDAPPPSRAVMADAAVRRAQYLQRMNEVVDWRIGQVKPGDPATLDMAAIACLLMRHQDAALCSQRVIELMKDPGSGPFWMFPCVAVAFAGRGQLSPAAQAAIREAWRTAYQVRGDTENHWAMYYTSLYLMSELYPNEPADSWFNGKSSAENLAEARSYLVSWMDLTTTVGQGEFNPTHYIGEYAIPMLYLASWAKDPAMRRRGHLMLDWLFSELAENTLNGLLSAPNARTDEGAIVERSHALVSYFSWQLFGNTPPPDGFGGFGVYFALAAAHYEVPEVIYRIATDRDGPYVLHDLKRTRRRWRYSDALFAPVCKTVYMTKDYVVGSYQGGLADPIQTHVWDVMWDTPDPRGVHDTMFSLHPYSSNHALQMYFTAYPDTMAQDVTKQGKPSYDSPDKVMGSSPYERVFQSLDTVIALYDIPPGTRFPQINGFFSKDLRDVTVDPSGWIFARGGRAYLAYRPLAGWHWEHYRHYTSGWATKTVDLGDRLLVSPHLKNGTIVQAANAGEFRSFADFQAAIRALPLAFALEPVPTVTLTTLRGRRVAFTYGEAPEVDGKKIDYASWPLFSGPYLNAAKGSRRLVITHGRLERVLDFNTLSITDTIRPD